jgi:hypothetical protein
VSLPGGGARRERERPAREEAVTLVSAGRALQWKTAVEDHGARDGACGAREAALEARYREQMELRLGLMRSDSEGVLMWFFFLRRFESRLRCS